MKKYAIQWQRCAWDPHSWEVCPSLQFDTLPEAQDAFERLPIKAGHRTMEAYTVVRYKPVKQGVRTDAKG